MGQGDGPAALFRLPRRALDVRGKGAAGWPHAGPGSRLGPGPGRRAPKRCRVLAGGPDMCRRPRSPSVGGSLAGWTGRRRIAARGRVGPNTKLRPAPRRRRPGPAALGRRVRCQVHPAAARAERSSSPDSVLQCVAAWVGFRIMEETPAGAAGPGWKPEAPPAARATGSESREPTADSAVVGWLPRATADRALPLQVSAPGTAQGRTAESRVAATPPPVPLCC